MNLHANAKLGLAGRRELVLAIERGLSLKQAAACFQRLAGDGAPLVASLARGRPRRRRRCSIAPRGRTGSRGG